MGNSKMKNLRPLEELFSSYYKFLYLKIFVCLFRVGNILSLSHHEQLLSSSDSAMIMRRIFKENMRMGTIELTDLSEKKLRIATN